MEYWTWKDLNMEGCGSMEENRMWRRADPRAGLGKAKWKLTMS